MKKAVSRPDILIKKHSIVPQASTLAVWSDSIKVDNMKIQFNQKTQDTSIII